MNRLIGQQNKARVDAPRRDGGKTRGGWRALRLLGLSWALFHWLPPATSLARDPGVVDLSLLVSPEMPGVWPVGMTPYMRSLTHRLELDGFQRDQVLIDEHTGTQWDAPAHFMSPPGAGLTNSGPNGEITGEKVEPWKFLGEACVIDVHEQTAQAAPGRSYEITPEVVKAWERRHRPLRAGDIAVFRGDYSDRYYKPFPEGDRYVRAVLNEEAHAWSGPTPECVEYLGERGVYALVVDGPSLGPVPDLPVPTHLAAARLGIIGTEGATGLGKLPTTGSVYVLLAANHAGGSGGEARALAITNPRVATPLLERIRERRVADLSVVLHEDYPVTWPGYAPGREAARYVGRTLNAFQDGRGPYFARTHVLDTQVGTHLTPSAHVLPPKGFRKARLPETVRTWLREFEKEHGRLPTGGQTAEQVPLEELMGRARVVPVASLLGTTSSNQWPACPVISRKSITEYEAKAGALAAGEIVLFESGYVDRYFKAIPEGTRLMADPLAGKAEGWPVLSLEALDYLAEKGIRCVGIDSPNFGGVRPREAQMFYWLAAKRGMRLVEFLAGLDAIADQSEAWFLFAPIKIAGAHGGYGRALAIY